MPFAILHPRRRADIETVRQALVNRRNLVRKATFLERFGGDAQVLAVAGRKVGLSVDGPTMIALMREWAAPIAETLRQFDKLLKIPPLTATLEQKQKLLDGAEKVAQASRLFSDLTAIANSEVVKMVENGELTVTGRTVKSDQQRAAELLAESSAVPRSERATPIADPKFPSFAGLEAAMLRLANPTPAAKQALEALGVKVDQMVTDELTKDGE